MRHKLLCLFLLLSFTLSGRAQSDEAIYERYCAEMKRADGLSMPDLMVKTARFFLGTPYVGGTLEQEPEQLVVNLRELDCMTLVENVVALVWTAKHTPSFALYKSALKRIRYRETGGETLDYTDRLHYTTDWVYENKKRGYIRDVTKEIGGKPLPLELSFMSTHPDSYKQLKGDEERIRKIAAKEQEINARQYYYIPEDEINRSADKIRNGDIVCFVTTIKGLDISHVGIICREEGILTFIHASTTGKQVVVNKGSLQEYVKGIKRNIGIMIVRPQF